MRTSNRLAPHWPAERERYEDPSTRGMWIAITVMAVAVAISARAAIQFATPYPAGMDAAHYANQTRSLLESGQLIRPDLPLAYVLYAAIGLGLRMAGHAMDPAAMLASRVGDVVIPALAIVPLMRFGRRVCEGALLGSLAVAACAITAVVAPGPMHMIGDFQKQAVGLLFISGSLVALSTYLARPGVKSGLLVLGWLLAAALTHIGIAAVAVAAAVPCGLVATVTAPNATPRLRATVAAATLGAAAVLAIAVSVVAPHKVQQLRQYAANAFDRPVLEQWLGRTPAGPMMMPRGRFASNEFPPMPNGGGFPDAGFPGAGFPGGDFPGGPMPGGPIPGGSTPGGTGTDGMPPMPAFGTDGPPPGMAPGMPGFPPAGTLRGDRGQPTMPPGMVPGGIPPKGLPMRGMPPAGMPGGPNTKAPLLNFLFVWASAIVVLAMLARRWRETAPSLRVTVLTAAALSMLLTLPVTGFMAYGRVASMASVPLAFALTWIAADAARRQRGAWLAAIPLALSTGLALQPSERPPMNPMDHDRATQLRTLAKAVPKGRVLLVARHGLEYWGTFFLHVPGQTRPRESDWSRYDQVIQLRERRGFGMLPELPGMPNSAAMMAAGMPGLPNLPPMGNLPGLPGMPGIGGMTSDPQATAFETDRTLGKTDQYELVVIRRLER
ncbi:MAG: hypothetical protein SFX74_01535 [Fimbriimonadaceae bacterium]|nr:hypothetical protein [Fimbriimonadaceae bacterium]